MNLCISKVLPWKMLFLLVDLYFHKNREPILKTVKMEFFFQSSLFDCPRNAYPLRLDNSHTCHRTFWDLYHLYRCEGHRWAHHQSFYQVKTSFLEFLLPSFWRDRPFLRSLRRILCGLVDIDPTCFMLYRQFPFNRFYIKIRAVNIGQFRPVGPSEQKQSVRTNFYVSILSMTKRNWKRIIFRIDWIFLNKIDLLSRTRSR